MNKLKWLLCALLLSSCSVTKTSEVRYLHIGYVCDQEGSTAYGCVDISWRAPYFPQEDSLTKYIQCSQNVRGTVLITGIYSFRSKLEFEQYSGKKAENMEHTSIDSLSLNCDLDQ